MAGTAWLGLNAKWIRSPRPYASAAEVGNLASSSANVRDSGDMQLLFEGRVTSFLDLRRRVH